MNRDQIADAILGKLRLEHVNGEAMINFRSVIEAADAIMALDGDARKAAYQEGWRDREDAFMADAARILPQPPGDAG